MTRRVVLAWFLSCMAGIFAGRQLVAGTQFRHQLPAGSLIPALLLLSGSLFCGGAAMTLLCGRLGSGEKIWSGRRFWYGLAAAAWFMTGAVMCRYAWNEPMRQYLEKLDKTRIQGIGRIEKVSEKGETVTIQLGSVYLTGQGEPASDINEERIYRKFPEGLHLILQKEGNFYYNRENNIVTNSIEKNNWIPGQRLEFIGEYRLYEKASNPGAFDYREYCHGIGVAGCVQVKETALKKVAGESRLQRLTWEIRQGIRRRILSLAEEEDRGILLCVLTGDKSELTDYWKKLYQDGGIIHLLTISGLHISILGMGFYRLMRKLTGHFLFSGIAAGGMTGIFCVMAGAGTSMVRAVICFWLYLLSGYVGKCYDLLTAVSFSGLLLLMEHPLLLFQSGFLMTFGCMMGVGVLLPLAELIFLQGDLEAETGTGSSIFSDHADTEIISGIQTGLACKKALLDACLIQVASLPVMLWFQGTWSVFGALINLATVPFMSLVLLSALAAVGPGSLFQPAGIFFLGTGHYILRWYEQVCLFTEHLRGSLWIAGRPEWQQILLWFVLLAAVLFYGYRKILLEKKGFPWICGVLLLPVSVWCLGRHPGSGLTVSFLDVGQGDGIVLEMPRKQGTVCIDGGSSSEKKLAEYVYAPFFRHEGIGKVEYWILTHPDADHYSGMIELLESGYEIDHILLPEVFQSSAFASELERFHPVEYIGTGDYMELGEIRLDIVHPEKKEYADAEANGETDRNELSAVVLLTWGSRSMLFTGDMGIEAEDAVLSELAQKGIGQGLEGHLEILKAAHHGSKFSTSEVFLDRLQPELAVISAGRNNRYGHPHQEVLNRLEAADIGWINTAESGCVQIRAGKSGYEMILPCGS